MRYAEAAGAPERLVAPPYDVIDRAERRRLAERSPHNAVHLVLPEGPVPERYHAARRRFRTWLRAGVLVEDRKPAVYVYRQSFLLDGARRERHALIAALELTPFEEGTVLPHEETHAAARQDRTELTLACKAQLSPVFLVAPDPDRALFRGLREAARSKEPTWKARTDEGEGHELWRIPGDVGAAGGLLEAASRRPLLIADGHHRYETALAVRGHLPDVPAARRILAAAVSEADPGLVVLPTHRAVALPLGPGGWQTRLEPFFETAEWEDEEPSAGGSWRALLESVAASASSARLAVVVPGDEPGRPGPAWLLRPRAEAVADLPPADREVPSVLVDRLVLCRALGLSAEEAAETGRLTYHRDPREAVGAAGPRGAAFLLSPPRLADVRAIAASGRRLPPKTTYFFPKFPSGLVYRRLRGAPEVGPGIRGKPSSGQSEGEERTA